MRQCSCTSRVYSTARVLTCGYCKLFFSHNLTNPYTNLLISWCFSVYNTSQLLLQCIQHTSQLLLQCTQLSGQRGTLGQDVPLPGEASGVEQGAIRANILTNEFERLGLYLVKSTRVLHDFTLQLRLVVKVWRLISTARLASGRRTCLTETRRPSDYFPCVFREG